MKNVRTRDAFADTLTKVSFTVSQWQSLLHFLQTEQPKDVSVIRSTSLKAVSCADIALPCAPAHGSAMTTAARNNYELELYSSKIMESCCILRSGMCTSEQLYNHPSEDTHREEKAQCRASPQNAGRFKQSGSGRGLLAMCIRYVANEVSFLVFFGREHAVLEWVMHAMWMINDRNERDTCTCQKDRVASSGHLVKTHAKTAVVGRLHGRARMVAISRRKRMVANTIADTPSLLAVMVRRRQFFQEALIMFLTLGLYVMPPDKVEVEPCFVVAALIRRAQAQDFVRNGR